MCVCARAVHYCRTRAIYYAHFRTLPHISETKQYHTLSTYTLQTLCATHVRYHVHYTCHRQTINPTPKHSTLSIPAALATAAAAAQRGEAWGLQRTEFFGPSAISQLSRSLHCDLLRSPPHLRPSPPPPPLRPPLRKHSRWRRERKVFFLPPQINGNSYLTITPRF